MKKIYFIILIIIIILTLFFNKNYILTYLNKKEIAKVQKTIKNEKYIIHAGGYIYNSNGQRKTYTNSKEALFNCYEKGHRVCEIDFRISADNKLVCIHDWNQLFLYEKRLTEPVDCETFLKGKILNSFSPIWLGNICDFIRDHKDFYIITDIKDNNIDACKIISEFCPELKDNFIIQIYHENQYENVSSLGFKNIIYTLYRTSESERSIDNLLDFSKKHPLVGFTFWYYWADDSDFLTGLKKTGIPLFIHTVNTSKEFSNYFNLGISGIYTDVVDTN